MFPATKETDADEDSQRRSKTEPGGADPKKNIRRDAKHASTTIVVLPCFEAGNETDTKGDSSKDEEVNVPVPPAFTITPPTSPSTSTIGM